MTTLGALELMRQFSKHSCPGELCEKQRSTSHLVLMSVGVHAAWLCVSVFIVLIKHKNSEEKERLGMSLEPEHEEELSGGLKRAKGIPIFHSAPRRPHTPGKTDGPASGS